MRQAVQRATRLLFGDFAEDEISDGEENISLSDNDSAMSVRRGRRLHNPGDTRIKSRDSSEIWHGGPLSDKKQHRAHDILRVTQGPTRQAIRSGFGDSASQSFKLFLSSDLVGSIVQHTNEEGLRNDPSRDALQLKKFTSSSTFFCLLEFIELSMSQLSSCGVKHMAVQSSKSDVAR